MKTNSLFTRIIQQENLRIPRNSMKYPIPLTVMYAYAFSRSLHTFSLPPINADSCQNLSAINRSSKRLQYSFPKSGEIVRVKYFSQKPEGKKVQKGIGSMLMSADGGKEVKRPTDHQTELVSLNISIPTLEEDILELDDEKARTQILAGLKETAPLIDKINKLLKKKDRSTSYPTIRSCIELIERLILPIGTLNLQEPDETLRSTLVKQKLQKPLSALREQVEDYLQEPDPQIREDRTNKTKALYCQQGWIENQSPLNAGLSILLKNIRALIERENCRALNSRCFISYAWPTLRYQKEEAWLQPFLRILHRHLTEAGIKPILDIVDNKTGGNIYRFMGQIKNVEFALLICTESLFLKHHDEKFVAVKTELNLLADKYETDLASGKTRVLPFLVSGSHQKSYPERYRMYSTVRDWRDQSYLQNLKQLMAVIYYPQGTTSDYETLWQTFYRNHSSAALDAVMKKEYVLAFEQSQFHEKEFQRLQQESFYQALLGQRATAETQPTSLTTTQIASSSSISVPTSLNGALLSPSLSMISMSSSSMLGSSPSILVTSACASPSSMASTYAPTSQLQSSGKLNSGPSSSSSNSSRTPTNPLTKEHTEEYSEGILQDLKFYVPSKVSATSLYSSTELLEDKIKGFLKSDKKVMLILGDSGAGKTLSSRYFARKIKNEYTKGSHQFNDYLPMYARLNKNAALDSRIIERVAGEQFSAEEIAELKKNKLLLFLDGYDEIRATANFYSDNQLEQYPSVKLIITCRLEYYTDTIGNHCKNFAPIDPASDYVCEDKLDTWYVAPFMSDEIENYVRGYLAHKKPKPQWGYEDWDSYRKEHRGSMNDSDVFSNPFILFAMMEIFEDMVKKKAIQKEKKMDTKEMKEIQGSKESMEKKEIIKLDRNEIYRRFITQWFNKQINQLSKDIRALLGKNEVTALWKHAKFLAMQLFFTAEESKETKISFEEESELAALMESSFQRGSNGQDAQPGAISTLVLRCLLLHKISDSDYAFIHCSVMEYLAALKLVGGVKTLVLPNELDQKGYDDLVKSPICKKLLSSSYTFIQFFSSEMRKDCEYTKIKDILFRIIRASRAIPKTVDSALVSTGAANAITLLNAAGIDFNGLDLHGIKIPGANLSGGQLDRTNLQDADMRGVNISDSWLRQCNLSGATLTDLKLGELPKITFSNEVRACGYSRDFRYLAVAVSNNIYLFDGLKRKHLHTFEGHTYAVTSVAFGPTGLLASGSMDQTVRLWDTEQKKHLHTFKGHTEHVTSAVFGPGGLLASGSMDQTVRLWDTEQKKHLHTFEGHTDSVTSVAFGPGGLLASGSGDQTVRLWDTEQKKRLYTFEGHTYSVTSVAFGPGGLLASGSNGNTVRLWDTEKNKHLHTFRGHTYRVLSVAFGPGGLLASGSGDKTVRLWYTEQRKHSHIFSGHTDWVNSVALGPGGLLASGSVDGTVRVWDMAQKKPMHTFDGYTSSVYSVALGPGGLLSSGSVDGAVCLWDTEKKKHLHTFEGHTSSVYSVAFGPGGQLASGSSDNTVRLWDTEKKKHLHTFERHTDSVKSVAFGPGRLLASGSFDQTVRLWDTEKKEHLHAFKGHISSVYSVAFGPGGLLASGSSDNTVRLWDTEKKKHLHTFEGHTSSVYSVAFGPGGLLASGSFDKTVRLWDTQQKKCVSIITGYLGEVTGVSWLENDQGVFLAAGSWDDSVRVWKITQLANNEFDIVLYFASQPNVLNLHRAIINGATGLSDDNLELFLQHEAKSTTASAKTGTSRGKKGDKTRSYNLPSSCMISGVNSLEMKESNLSSSAMRFSTSAMQVSATALLRIGTFGSACSSSMAAMSSSSSVSTNSRGTYSMTNDKKWRLR